MECEGVFCFLLGGLCGAYSEGFVDLNKGTVVRGVAGLFLGSGVGLCVFVESCVLFFVCCKLLI